MAESGTITTLLDCLEAPGFTHLWVCILTCQTMSSFSLEEEWCSPALLPFLMPWYCSPKDPFPHTINHFPSPWTIFREQLYWFVCFPRRWVRFVCERKCVCTSIGWGIEAWGLRAFNINILSLKETINLPRGKRKAWLILSLVPSLVLGLQYELCKSNLTENRWTVASPGLECTQPLKDFGQCTEKVRFSCLLHGLF